MKRQENKPVKARNRFGFPYKPAQNRRLLLKLSWHWYSSITWFQLTCQLAVPDHSMSFFLQQPCFLAILRTYKLQMARQKTSHFTFNTAAISTMEVCSIWPRRIKPTSKQNAFGTCLVSCPIEMAPGLYFFNSSSVPRLGERRFILLGVC